MNRPGETRPAVLDAERLAKACRSLARRDPLLRKVIRKVGACGLKPGRQPDHLTALVRSIVFQQLSGKAASTIFARVAERVGPDTSDPKAWLRVGDDSFREAGLSRQKISYVRDLCERVSNGRLPLEDLEWLEDDALVEVLTAVRGFGRWSAHMYLIFHLGRPDVWPTEDLGIRKALQRLDRLVELPSPAQIVDRGEAWRPYRSVASWYCWRVLDVAPEDVGW